MTLSRTKRSVTALALLLGLTSAALSIAADHSAPVVVRYEHANFVPVNARLPDGPRMAVLWGDPTSGPSAVLLEMKTGAVPLHVHSADYHLVVVEGVMKHWAEPQDESRAPSLGPGSYWFQPGGQAHADACLSERCVMQIVWAGARDGRLVVTTNE